MIIRMMGTQTLWKVNGRTVDIKSSSLKDRLVAEKPFEGSVSLFTNGEMVYFSYIQIKAELNPDWVDEQLVEVALRELQEIDGDIQR